MLYFIMLDFGKYAFYVWMSYGISAVVLAGLVILTLRRQRK